MGKTTFQIADGFLNRSAMENREIDFTDIEAVQRYANDALGLWIVSDATAKFILETLQRVHERHLNGEVIDWFYDFKKPLLEY